MNKVCVFGSINMDNTFYMKSLPQVGETLKSNRKLTSPGGKGLNQAVSAARLGTKVSFVGAVGKDEAGQELVTTLEKEGIDTSHISIEETEYTGEATIFIEEKGKNMIVVNSGANDKAVFEAKELMKEADILVSQFEVSMDQIEEASKLAKSLGKVTVLNPAPAKAMSDNLLRYTDIFIPNETEFEFFIGEKLNDDLDAMYEKTKDFFKEGVKVVLITMGEKGSLICTKTGYEVVPAFKVDVVDTTAAGDSFVGALVSKLDVTKIEELGHLQEVVTFANYFASKVVQKKGAMVSIPTKEEINF